MIITIRLSDFMEYISECANYDLSDKIEAIKSLRRTHFISFSGKDCCGDEILGLYEAKLIVEILLMNLDSQLCDKESLAFPQLKRFNLGKPQSHMEIEEIEHIIEFVIKTRYSNASVYFSLY